MEPMEKPVYDKRDKQFYDTTVYTGILNRARVYCGYDKYNVLLQIENYNGRWEFYNYGSPFGQMWYGQYAQIPLAMSGNLIIYNFPYKVIHWSTNPNHLPTGKRA